MPRKAKQDQLNVPMSAMIDVVFLLLIFFIVTYQEDFVESHTIMDRPVPAKQEASPAPTPQLLEIHVRPGQYLMMGQTPITLPMIASSLKMFMQYDTDQIVVVKVHGNAKHEELIALVDHCKKAGVTNLNVTRLRDS